MCDMMNTFTQCRNPAVQMNDSTLFLVGTHSLHLILWMVFCINAIYSSILNNYSNIANLCSYHTVTRLLLSLNSHTNGFVQTTCSVCVCVCVCENIQGDSPLLPQSAQDSSSSGRLSRFDSFVPRQKLHIGMGSTRSWVGTQTETNCLKNRNGHRLCMKCLEAGCFWTFHLVRIFEITVEALLVNARQ